MPFCLHNLHPNLRNTRSTHAGSMWYKITHWKKSINFILQFPIYNHSGSVRNATWTKQTPRWLHSSITGRGYTIWQWAGRTITMPCLIACVKWSHRKTYNPSLSRTRKCSAGHTWWLYIALTYQGSRPSSTSVRHTTQLRTTETHDRTNAYKPTRHSSYRTRRVASSWYCCYVTDDKVTTTNQVTDTTDHRKIKLTVGGSYQTEGAMTNQDPGAH